MKAKIYNLLFSAFALLTLFALNGCCKDNQDKFEMPYMHVASPHETGGNIIIKQQGGTVNIVFDTNRNWHVEVGNPFFEVTPRNGKAGENRITIKALANTGTRCISTLKLVTLSNTVAFTVSQEGTQPGGDVIPPDGKGGDNDGGGNDGGNTPKPTANGIAKLLEMGKKLDTNKGTTVVNEDITIQAMVVTNYTGKQFPFAGYHHIQDTDGYAMVLTLAKGTGSPIAFGKTVTFNAKGAKLTNYFGTIQLEINGKQVTQTNGAAIQPKVVTIEDVLAGKYDYMLVKVENVHIDKPQGTLYDGTYTSKRHNLMDAGGKWTSMEVWKTAVFGDEATPTGTGSVTAVVTINVTKDGKTYRNLRPSVRADINLDQ